MRDLIIGLIFGAAIAFSIVNEVAGDGSAILHIIESQLAPGESK